MYNIFLSQKKKKTHEHSTIVEKRMNNWRQQYHQRVQPELLDRYNQRINNFITKVYTRSILDLIKPR